MVSLHIEPTSRCTLACPRCERTNFIEKFGKQNFAINDINIDALKLFIDTPIEKILLCGNTGDPIYHRKFIELVSVLTKKCNCLTIITNGSAKSRKWWKSLNSVLRSSDEIQFSIDGLPKNFTQYRVNADWDSILVGIEECVAGPAKTVWKYIPFSFNEHDVAEIKELSDSLGIDEFKIEASDRWLNDDPLRPTQYKGPREKDKQAYQNQKQKGIKINPMCKDSTEHYISSRGLYSACCKIPYYLFYYKSNWWKNKEKHDIRTSRLSEQIDYFNTWYPSIQTNRYDYCIFECGECK